MLLPVYLGLLDSSEEALAESFRQVAKGHGDEPDVFHLSHTLAAQCDAHRGALAPVVRRYGERPDGEPERLHAAALSKPRKGPLGLLRDLQDLYLLASLVDVTWTAVKQRPWGCATPNWSESCRHASERRRCSSPGSARGSSKRPRKL